MRQSSSSSSSTTTTTTMAGLQFFLHRPPLLGQSLLCKCLRHTSMTTSKLITTVIMPWSANTLRKGSPSSNVKTRENGRKPGHYHRVPRRVYRRSFSNSFNGTKAARYEILAPTIEKSTAIELCQ